MRTLEDLFRKKSTSTIKQRVGSMGLFIAWFNITRPFDSFLPIQEEAVYDYACECRDQGRSASRVETLFGTLKYAGHVFQFPGAVEAASSPGVEGASHGLFLTKPPRSRAKELSPTRLCWLGIACFSLPHALDRVVAGWCMLCAMGRLRSSFKSTDACLPDWEVLRRCSHSRKDSEKQGENYFLSGIGVPCIWTLGQKNGLREFLLSRDELGLASVPSLASRSNDIRYVLVPSSASIEVF